MRELRNFSLFQVIFSLFVVAYYTARYFTTGEPIKLAVAVVWFMCTIMWFTSWRTLRRK